MPDFQGLRRFMRIDRSRHAVDRAVDDELQFHFAMTIRDLMANGFSPDDARREARRRFGDVQRTRERLTTIDRAREGVERRTEWWSAFAQDLRYALRGLRLKPGFLAQMSRTKEEQFAYFSYRRYSDIKEATTSSLDAMTPFFLNSLAIGRGDATKEMLVAIAGADLWKMFSAKPVIGRFAASWVPALRAARVDPNQALRAE